MRRWNGMLFQGLLKRLFISQVSSNEVRRVVLICGHLDRYLTSRRKPLNQFFKFFILFWIPRIWHKVSLKLLFIQFSYVKGNKKIGKNREKSLLKPNLIIIIFFI